MSKDNDTLGTKHCWDFFNCQRKESCMVFNSKRKLPCWEQLGNRPIGGPCCPDIKECCFCDFWKHRNLNPDTVDKVLVAVRKENIKRRNRRRKKRRR